MFLRLKRAELADPSLKKDASRKRMSHLTQFLAFIFGVGYIVYFIFGLMNGTTSSYGEVNSVAESFMHMLITLGIAGSIFAYLWHDEHMATKE
jgi:preprotein translocase subunit SecY